MTLTRTAVDRKDSYTRGEIDEWTEILRRRKLVQPACSLDAAKALASLDKGAVLEHYDGDSGRVTVRWIPKPDGRLRLEAFATPTGFDDEEATASALAEVVRAQGKSGNRVYWYDGNPTSESAESRVFATLAKLLGVEKQKSGMWEMFP